MTSKAKVISVDGNIAEIETNRISMCDGCRKKSCSAPCSISGLMEKNGVMHARAVNKINAAAGDSVEVETSDRRVFFLAAFVFIMPIFAFILFYFAAIAFGFEETAAIIASVVGFALAFVAIGLFERRRAGSEPEVTIVKIINVESSDIQENN